MGSSCLRLWIGTTLVLWLSSGLPGVANASTNLAKKCTEQTSVNKDDLQALLAEISMSDLQFRSKLLTLLRDPKNGCRKALETRLSEVKEKPANFISNTGRHAALTLGLLLEIPVALQIVESEAASSGATEWLAMLQQWDEVAYRGLLKKWVVRSSEILRQHTGLLKSGAEAYGKVQIEERNVPAEKTVIAPLVLDLYLKSIAGRAPALDEFSALNIHYASANAGSRQLFRESFTALVKKNSSTWITSFRSERAWTQFQMIDVMAQVGGSEMVKELLWLSQNHIDPRMKSRASQALDEALKLR